MLKRSGFNDNPNTYLSSFPFFSFSYLSLLLELVFMELNILPPLGPQNWPFQQLYHFRLVLFGSQYIIVISCILKPSTLILSLSVSSINLSSSCIFSLCLILQSVGSRHIFIMFARISPAHILLSLHLSLFSLPSFLALSSPSLINHSLFKFALLLFPLFSIGGLPFALSSTSVFQPPCVLLSLHSSLFCLCRFSFSSHFHLALFIFTSLFLFSPRSFHFHLGLPFLLTSIPSCLLIFCILIFFFLVPRFPSSFSRPNWTFFVSLEASSLCRHAAPLNQYAFTHSLNISLFWEV